MPPSVLSYVQGGCGDEFTQSQNANAFHHWGIVLACWWTALRATSPLTSSASCSPLRFFSARSVFLASVLRMATATSQFATPQRRKRRACMIASTLSNDTLECGSLKALGDTPGRVPGFTPRRTKLSPKASSIAPRLRASKPIVRHTRHLASRMATTRPQRREPPAVARGRTSELLYGSLLSPLTRKAS